MHYAVLQVSSIKWNMSTNLLSFLQLDGSIWAFCNIGALGCNKKAQWWTSFLDLNVFLEIFHGGWGASLASLGWSFSIQKNIANLLCSEWPFWSLILWNYWGNWGNGGGVISTNNFFLQILIEENKFLKKSQYSFPKPTGRGSRAVWKISKQWVIEEVPKDFHPTIPYIHL